MKGNNHGNWLVVRLDASNENGSPTSSNSGELLSSVPSTLDECLERYLSE